MNLTTVPHRRRSSCASSRGSGGEAMHAAAVAAVSAGPIVEEVASPKKPPLVPVVQRKLILEEESPPLPPPADIPDDVLDDLSSSSSEDDSDRYRDDHSSSGLGSWDFDPWAMHVDCVLEHTSVYWMRRLCPGGGPSLAETLGIRDTAQLARAAAALYKDNPYHNQHHAADVMNSACWLLIQPSLAKRVTATEMLAVVLAAMMHDVEHNGMNNRFHCATSSQLAVLYNDASVLEAHSCSLGWRLITGSSPAQPVDVLRRISDADRLIVRKLFIDLILSTDMAAHFKLLSEFANATASTKSSRRLFNKQQKEEEESEGFTELLLKMTIKLADIASPAKTNPLNEMWSARVMEEFFLQGDKEKDLGLDVSPFCDRSAVNAANVQLSFIDYIVEPLFRAMMPVFDGSLPLNVLLDNRAHWAKQRRRASTDESEDKKKKKSLFTKLKKIGKKKVKD